MKNYTVMDTRNRACETVGHVLSIDFSPGSPSMDCSEHPAQYVNLQADGSSISGDLAEEKLTFTATRSGSKVECTLHEKEGGSNEVGSWTAEEGGLGGG